MWKWIGGVLLVIVIALAGTCYAGYRRLTAGGDSVVVTIHGDANRVFASLANPDSMLVWMLPGSEVTPIGNGAFKPGDTVRISSPSTRGDTTRRTPQLWVVREVHAPASFVVDAIQFNTSGTPHVIYTRRDSVITIGDSTRVVSSFAMADNPMGVPVSPNAGGAQRTMMGVAEKMLVGAAKMMTDVQMKQLKTHIEQPER